MKKTYAELAGIIGCTINTIRTYAARAEFAHWRRMRDKKLRCCYIENVFEQDIDRLNRLINRKKAEIRR